MHQNDEKITRYAEPCLNYLIANPEELARFMDIAGLSPSALRSAIGKRDFEHGLIDYFAQNESALLAMCANAGFTPEQFMRVWHQLNAEAE